MAAETPTSIIIFLKLQLLASMEKFSAFSIQSRLPLRLQAWPRPSLFNNTLNFFWFIFNRRLGPLLRRRLPSSDPPRQICGILPDRRQPALAVVIFSFLATSSSFPFSYFARPPSRSPRLGRFTASSSSSACRTFDPAAVHGRIRSAPGHSSKIGQDPFGLASWRILSAWSHRLPSSDDEANRSVVLPLRVDAPVSPPPSPSSPELCRPSPSQPWPPPPSPRPSRPP